jgi:hypothetical protein
MLGRIAMTSILVKCPESFGLILRDTQPVHLVHREESYCGASNSNKSSDEGFTRDEARGNWDGVKVECFFIQP